MENEKLRNARFKKGWTLKVAASKIGDGIHPNTLASWERGIHSPGVSMLVPLQKAYGLSLWELGLEHLVGEGTHTQGMQDSAELFPVSAESGAKGGILRTEDLGIRLFAYVYQWNRRNIVYDDLQARIQQEIRSYDEMTDQHDHNQLEDPERRIALRFLARMPIQLYGLTALGGVTNVAAEEMLPHCAAGLTACWQLSNGIDLPLAQATLAAYLPTLTTIAKQSNKHQQAAAGLVAQGYLLKSMLGWHLESLEKAEWYSKQAMTFSNIANDPNLQATSLKQLGTVYYYSGKPKKALDVCKEATLYLKQAHVAVQSFVYRELASYQAINGQKQDALLSLGRAHEAFYHPSVHDGPAYAAYDEFELTLWDGLTHRHLGQPKKALDFFLQIDGLKPKKPISERVRIEFVNNQALLELQHKDRDMEQCIAYWLAGVQGAIALKSERRYAEVREVYQNMQCVWPDEKRITELQPYMRLWDE